MVNKLSRYQKSKTKSRISKQEQGQQAGTKWGNSTNQSTSKTDELHQPRNTILACQDQYFAGGQSYDCPYFSSTSASTVDVSKETWVSLWASGLLDNKSSNQGPHSHGQAYNFGGLFQGDLLWGDQLSSQMFANKQLQDTLIQKEEELARLHEENNKLKQYLNSTYVKSLEEKAKKLMSQDSLPSFGAPKKRKARESTLSSPDSQAKKAKRNLYDDFTACEQQTSSTVDTWVLQTLGLKDVNTIDESDSANYSALSSHLLHHLQGADYCNIQGSPSSGYGTAHVTPTHSQDASTYSQDSPYLHDLSPSHCGSTSSLPGSQPVSPFASPIYYTPDVSPNKTEVAFSTSLSPHNNVKTHSFSQGQAFVRRDNEGGWKFTWVPKQSE
ncbi:geminin coiled-coil domain-containing protein 1 [Spea bombifrons]|uniref:geminin coiled-coil domain-containing protein 1 n=1 Tax=Spea bombifrons TaxID=233779 RepID=UPI00234B4956|nr:geminin coiled-coil domain-containing protein 1 [Spea bombifrons]